MCSSAHFACRDCSDARDWGLGYKGVICRFGKISDAGRRNSGKHNTNGLWKLLQERGAVNRGLLVISCSERVHISEEARWFAVTQNGNSKKGSILVSLSEAKVVISSVFSASNLPMTGGFRRKADISSAVVLSRPCTARWYLVSSAVIFLVANWDSRRKN